LIRLLLFCITIELAPHALHHIVLGLFMLVYAGSRGARIGGSSGATSI
jgi:hypothetical protein